MRQFDCCELKGKFALWTQIMPQHLFSRFAITFKYLTNNHSSYWNRLSCLTKRAGLFFMVLSWKPAILWFWICFFFWSPKTSKIINSLIPSSTAWIFPLYFQLPYMPEHGYLNFLKCMRMVVTYKTVVLWFDFFENCSHEP